MFPGRVTVFPDATTLFADVITIAADLAIGHHRGPLSGRCKQGITEQCTRPSRMPGRNNMSRYDSFQLPTPPSPAKSNNRKRLIKRLRWRYEEKTYTFFSTRYKDNYEPLIANVEFCVVPHRRVQRTHRIQPDVKSVCCGRPPSQPF